MDEIRSRALRFIKLEEDKEIQKRDNMLSSYKNPNRKFESLAQRSYKSKPYSKLDHHRVNALNDEGEEDEFSKLLFTASLWRFQVKYSPCMILVTKQDGQERERSRTVGKTNPSSMHIMRTSVTTLRTA